MRQNPRIIRLVRALLSGPQTARGLVDLIPANNPAEYVKQLRRQYSLSVVCEHVSFTTMDGKLSWHGRYHLTAEDREKLQALFGQAMAGGAA